MESLPPFIPLTISWNLTRRCNLACAHCYIDASSRMKGNGELSEEESLHVLQLLAKVNREAVLILTGGEPLLRKDLFHLISEANSLGFYPVLGSHGGLLSAETAEKLIASGLKGVGVSLDSLQPEKHNRFRGIAKSWEKTVESLDVMREKGLPFLIETTLMHHNFEEIEALAQFSYEKGASALNIFFLVPTGRGANLTDLTPQEYEEAFQRMARLQEAYAEKLLINAKCAPHYRRVLWEINPNSPFVRTFKGGGCPAGTYYCRITPEGNVTPCPYMPLAVGNLREKSFEDIWKNSPILHEFRTGKLSGKCGICEFREFCGGCRCRAYAASGNYLDEDPSCLYEPGQYPEASISLPLEKTYGSWKSHQTEITWTEEATARLQKIPFFARGMVKKAIESYAQKEGCSFITESFMIKLREKMQGKFPFKNFT
jgi:radical SAM protein with 4Fe4S-binding SPASM domain